ARRAGDEGSMNACIGPSGRWRVLAALFRPGALSAVFVAATVLLSACGSSRPTPRSAQTVRRVDFATARPAVARRGGVPAFGHVFLIVGENASFSEITRRHAPYVTGTLIPHGAWLTHYFALTDGSLGDYAAMVSGQFVRCESNNDFSFTNG